MIKQVVAALIVRGDEILCCQRTEYQALPLKWEFPGGKIEAGEEPPQALHRELGPTTLLVTHNVALAERCDRTVRLGAMPMLGATSSGS